MRLEGVWLGNLGDALLSSNQIDEAQSSLEQAIGLGDQTFPVAAGSYRGSLALLFAQQERHQEAYQLLDTGEPQVRNSPEEHAKFLCKKGKVFLLTGNAAKGQKACEEAQAIAAQLNVSADSEISRSISELVALLE